MKKTTTSKPPIAWTIAGSDSGGGAGIQADLLTFKDFGVHGCSVITALTAQNSTKVAHIEVTSAESLQQQLHTLAEDLPPAAIKIGMLASSHIVKIVAEFIEHFEGLVVYDPVMKSSTGQSLLDTDAKSLICEKLLPKVSLLTPNTDEAALLSDLTINNCDDIEAAAEKILSMDCQSVLITGGHFIAKQGKRLDYWANEHEHFWLSGEDIQSSHTHGSGCTLSSAIAANLAKGYELCDAPVLAKAYVSQGIRNANPLGEGPGPVAHQGSKTKLSDFPRVFLSAESATSEALQFPSCDGELGLYPVVDSADWIEKLLPLGPKTIQLRVKDKPSDFLKQEIGRAVKLAKQYGARLFINDYWQLAIEAGAYGVHLGQEDLVDADLQKIAKAGLRLGISTHSDFEIARAHSISPSYIAIGPIYSTTTKVMKFAPQGLEQLSIWTELLKEHYPLTAIGGISLERAPGVLATGVGSVAVVTAITEAEDYRHAVEELMKAHLLQSQ